MCGIAGIAGRKLNFDSSNIVEKMSLEVSHRGPDGAGLWCDTEKNVAIAHRRLAIVDLSTSGSQPMLSGCGRYVLSFNGEIYNFQELRKTLSYSEWRGSSDTEVLLVAIASWGLEEALKQVQGMFALCLYDRHNNMLHLARDRWGEKPLFFSRKGGYLSFASELSAFKHIRWFKYEIDISALSHYFEFGFTGDEASIYKSISKVGLGSIISYDLSNDCLKTRSYFDNKDAKTSEKKSNLQPYKEVVGHVEQMLTDTIKKQMRMDVGYGAFLSGGIDSSVVVALMQKNSAKKIDTFSIGNEDTAFDESTSARQISSLLGTNHNELMLTNKVISEEIRHITDFMDEPFADSSFIPTILLSRFAKKKVKVCLTGDAGDEVFSGYNRYKWVHRKKSLDDSFSGNFINPALHLSLFLSDRNLAKIYLLLEGLLPSFARMHFPEDKFRKIRKIYSKTTTEDVYFGLLSDEYARENVIGFVPFETPHSFLEPLNLKKLIQLDQFFYMPFDILKKVDLATMASGLEARVPYLDHNIVQYCQRLPVEYLMKNGKTKSILRDILVDFIPIKNIERPKMGFGIPVSEILRTTLRCYVEDLFSSAKCYSEGLINFENLKNSWLAFLRGETKYDEQVWRAVIFLSWLEGQRKSVQ